MANWVKKQKGRAFAGAAATGDGGRGGGVAWGTSQSHRRWGRIQGLHCSQGSLDGDCSIAGRSPIAIPSGIFLFFKFNSIDFRPEFGFIFPRLF
jgi:hypothetical protein